VPDHHGAPAPTQLLALPDGRRVLRLAGGPPAIFCYIDPLAGGVLVGTPRFEPDLLAALPPVRFIVYPSARSATDVGAWREATGARVVAGVGEPLDGPVDERADGTIRITGRLDFLACAGATPGTIALRSKGPPALVFFGPALAQAQGWPQLVPDAADWSWEHRLIGALGIAALPFDYAFCDDHGTASRIGPSASSHVAAFIEAMP
jgi:hypothetical protein